MTDTGYAREQSVLTRRWASAMVNRCNVPLPRSEVLELFDGFVRRLATAITTEPFDAAEGGRIGAEMIAHNMVQPDALGETLRLLGDHLLSTAGLAEDAANRQRLTMLTAQLATDYMHHARDRIFSDQDLIKTAVVRARERSEHAHKISEARFKTVFNATTIGIVIADLDGSISQTNPALGRMLGYSEAALTQMRVEDLVHAEDWPRLAEQFRLLCDGLNADDNFIELPRLLQRDGEPIWSRIVVSLVRDDATGEPSYPVAMVENTSDMHLLHVQLQQQSVADRLTGLANESRMRSHLESILANDDPQSRVALSFWDLDGFRVLNDGLGRKLGDEMLTTVATKLRSFFEPNGGLVARLAGDGFAVVLPNAPERYETTQLIQAAMNELGEPFYPDGGHEGVAASASVGIVVEEVGNAELDELIRSAEITLHRAKTGGKAQWVLAEPDTDADEKRRCRLGAVLPGALETGEFMVRYQPMFWLDERGIAGVHAYSMWNHPEHGLIRPGAFMPQAEETGMVMPIGRWMLNELCAQAARWLARYGEAAPVISLRLASRVINDQDLVSEVNEILNRHDVPAGQIQFSVPATALMAPAATDTLIALAENGVRMGVNGVGAGGLSLTRLRDLPLRDVSMNPALVETVTELGAMETSPFERGLTCLVGIAHDLQCTVTVGNLQDPDKLDRLHKYGVDIGFGPALQPMGPAESIEQVLDAAHR